VRLFVLIVGLAVLVLGGAAVFGSSFSGPQVVQEIEESFALQTGKELIVHGSNGSVTYEGWNGDEVVITAVKESSALTRGLAQRVADRVRVELTQDERGVRAIERRGVDFLLFGQVSIAYHVRVPYEWSGEVELRTSNGRITASDLHGDAELRTSNGAISVERQSGSLSAHTSNGRVELAEVHGAVQVETSNGPIRVDGGTLERTGRLRSSNGPIHLYASLAPQSAYDVRTSNGSVTLVLAEPDVQVDLSTSNGGIELQTDVNVSEFDRNRLVGRIGDGSARLGVRTSNGRISLSVEENRDREGTSQ